MNPKTILTEEGWDEVAPDCKGKDKELKRALFFYWGLEDDDFDFRGKALGKIAALAGTLKSANEVKGDKDAVKHLTDVISAAKSKQSELIKAKAEAEKTKALAAKTAALTQKKADAEAKQQEQEEAGGEEEEEEEEAGDSFAKLTTALKTLKLSKKPYYFLVCDAKPYGLMVSKKDIRKNAQARKELAKMAGGSTRPPKVGECRCDSGKYVFEMEKPPSGLARILQKWIKESIGLRLKVMVGTESAEDEEGAGQPENKQPKEERPAPLPALAKAPEVWHQTRRNIETSIGQLKTAVRKEFAGEGADLVAEIDGNMRKLDGILGKLDDRLAGSLEKANAAKDAAARKTELTNAKSLLADYIKYVKSEPMIAHIDSNPFGVKTNLKQTLTASLTQMAKTIG